METRRILSAIIEDIGKGNFQIARSKLISNGILLDAVQAVKLIVACSGACADVTKTPAVVSDDELMCFLKLVVGGIQTLSSDRFDCYIRAVYYIMKFLIEKESFQHIQESEKVIIPKFMPSPLIDQHKYTYRSIGKLIYDSLMEKGQLLNFPQEYSYSFYKLAAKIWVCCMEKHKYIDLCYHCVYSLITMKLPKEKQKEYFCYVLRNYDKCTNDSPIENQYHSLINILQLQYFNFFKVNDFASSLLCYQEWGKIVEKYFTSQETIYLHHILEFCSLIIEPDRQNKSEVLKHCHGGLKMYCKLYKLDESLKVTLNMIACIAASLVYNYYRKVDKSPWTGSPEDVQINIFNFLSDVSHILVQMSHSSAYSICDKKLPLNNVIKLIGANITLGKWYITYNKSISKRFKQDILMFIERSIPYILALKENDIEEWKTCWSEVGIGLYNMSVQLYKIDDDDSLKYINLFLQKLVLVEDIPHSSVLGHNILYSSLILIAEAYFKSNQLRKCLVVTALILAICPEKRDAEISRWIKIKITAKDNNILGSHDDFQKITITSALEKYKNEVLELIPNFSLNLSDKIQLLYFELEQYKQRWKSRAPMMTVYKELCQIADVASLVDVTVKIWYDFNGSFHEEIPLLIHLVVNKYESSCNDAENNNISLAFLYFSYYIYKFKNTVVKQNADVEASVLYMESRNSSQEPNADPSDECDIVSSYELLKVDKHVVLTRYLSKSLTLISSICKNTDYSTIKNHTLADVYNLLIKISYEYRLHGNHLLYLQASELALKVAEIIDNKVYILQALANIVEIADVTKDYIKKLIQKGDSIVPEIDAECQESLKAIIKYYIARGNVYLYVDVPEADASYRQASLYHVLWKGKEDLALNAQLYLLQANLIMRPCEFKIQGHNEFSLVQIHFAHACVMTILNKYLGMESSYSLSVVFEVKEALVRMYHLQKLPREVRCYGKDTVILAQKFLLPLRTATLLTYLAHADLLSRRFDDCKVKVSGLSDILCLSKCKSSMQQIVQQTSKLDLNDAYHDHPTLDVNEVSLDLPQSQSKFTKQLSPSSPTLVLDDFKSPDFIKHDATCGCFPCVCLEHQNLILLKLHLEALINIYQDNMSLAQRFFTGGIELYKKLSRKKENYISKASDFINIGLVTNPEVFHLEAYCYLLFDYSNQLLRLKDKKVTKLLNKQQIDILRPLKLKFIYLYNEVLLQKIHIYHEMPVEENSESTLKVDQSQNVALLRTPESKCTKVSFAIQCCPKPPSPPLRVTKGIFFDLSDTEENLTVIKKDLSSLNPKTPIPTNMKVYPPASKSAIKKKPPRFDIPGSVPSETSIKNKMLDTTFLAPATPCTKENKEAEKVKSGLRSRTRLLTQKLQNTDRKEVTASDENAVAKESKERISKATARKNLFDSQNGHSSNRDGNSLGSGAVRRSTRRKT